MGSMVKNLFIILVLFMIAAMTADAGTDATEASEVEPLDIDEKILSVPQQTSEISGINRAPAIVTDDMSEDVFDNYNSDEYANQNIPNGELDEPQSSNTDEENSNYDDDSYSGDFEATYTE